MSAPSHRIRLEPARYGIVGSRTYAQLYRVQAFVRRLPAGSTVISGHARGVDITAEEAATERGLAVISYPADWSKGKGAGFERNTQIMEAADIIVAFWDGQSRGTMDTVRKARAAGKRVWLCSFSGRWDFSGDAEAPIELRDPVAANPDAPWIKPPLPPKRRLQ